MRTNRCIEGNDGYFEKYNKIDLIKMYLNHYLQNFHTDRLLNVIIEDMVTLKIPPPVYLRHLTRVK